MPETPITCIQSQLTSLRAQKKLELVTTAIRVHTWLFSSRLPLPIHITRMRSNTKGVSVATSTQENHGRKEGEPMPLFSPSPPHIHTPHTHTQQLNHYYLPRVALLSSYVKSKKERFILEQRTLFPRGFSIRTHHPAITRKLRMHIYLSICVALFFNVLAARKGNASQRISLAL